MADPLEELKKRLYKKGESFEKRLRRPALTPGLKKAPGFWKEPGVLSPEGKNFMRSRFLWIVIGTAALLALALFYFLGGFGIFYRDSVDLKISGPEALEGGERMRWDVLATNRGSKTLEDVELLFEYPVGSKPLDAKAKALRDRKAIGKIAPGESVAAFFEAFVFGTQGEELSAKAELEYRPEDSSAILAKEKTFSTRIISSPIGISVDLPQEIRAGQETEIKISYVSNAQSELQDLFLKVEPPFGFSLKSARPAADEDGFWKIGTLEPGENGVVVIKGILAGSDGEEKSFRAAIGLKNREGALDVYGGGVGTLTVKRPFLDIGIKLNGEKTRIAKAGEILEGEVSFKNNLPSPVANARIEVFFKGTGLDERQIRVEDGTFNASSRSILWNAASNEALRNLDPGQEGIVKFRFAFADFPPRSSVDKNFSLALAAKITPGQVPSGFSGADVTGEDAAEAKLASELQLARRGFYFSPLLPNSGPLPPKVGQETTFTVVWSLINSTNDADGVLVKAALPSYASWKGVFLPQNEDLAFHSASGEILWKVGFLKAGTGFLNPAREVRFQVGFIPGTGQVGASPEIVGRALAEGHDMFTDTALLAEASELTTELPDDPKVDFNQTRVVP